MRICAISGINGRSSERPSSAVSSAGFKLLELVIVMAIATVVTVIAILTFSTTMTSLHLGSTATSLSSALQGIRYQAVAYGCPLQVTISVQTFSLAAPAISGTPQQCASTYTNVASALPWVTTGNLSYPFASSDISLTSATTQTSINCTPPSCTPTSLTFPVTIQFNPDGTVHSAYASGTSPVPAPTIFTLVLTPNKSTATKTITISGVGYVTVH